MRISYEQRSAVENAIDAASEHMPGDEIVAEIVAEIPWIDVDTPAISDMPGALSVRFPGKCESGGRNVTGVYVVLFDGEHIIHMRHSATGMLAVPREFAR